MISFDEFRANRNRERSKTPKVDESTSKSISSNEKPGRFAAIGDFIETHQMQTFCIALLLLDTFASFAEIYLSAIGEVPINWESKRRACIVTLQAFTNFTIIFFGLELFAALMAFQLSMFGHFGYFIDVFVVFFQSYLEYHGFGKITRILNLLRLWRLARLFNSMLGVEKDMHEQTKELLEEKDAQLRKLESDSQQIATDLLKEKDARTSIEDMLQSYKEEVETLNEALKIAAMDIAEVAEADDEEFVNSDYENEEDDEADEDDDEGHVIDAHKPLRTIKEKNSPADGSEEDEDGEKGGQHFHDTVTSQHDRAGNKLAMIRAVRSDGGGGSVSGRSSGSVSVSTAATAGVTFMISQDGSFQRK